MLTKNRPGRFGTPLRFVRGVGTVGRGDECHLNVDAARLADYRRRLYTGQPPVSTPEQALEFVRRCGFVYAFTPGQGELPALFPVLATEREGQRWDWAWNWRDQLLENRQAYAARLLWQKPMLVQPEWLPALYGMAGHTADPDEDIAAAAEAGHANPLMRRLYGYIQEKGPTSTRTLLKNLGDGSKETKQGIETGLLRLEERLLIAPVRAEGGNSIARVYDLFPRAWPEAAAAGADLPTRVAGRQVVAHLFTLTGALTADQVEKGAAWALPQVRRALGELVAEGALAAATVNRKPGYTRPELLTG